MHVLATSTLRQVKTTVPYQVGEKCQVLSGAMVQIATKEVLRREEPPVSVIKRGLPQHQLEKVLRFLLNCSETLVHGFNLNKLHVAYLVINTLMSQLLHYLQVSRQIFFTYFFSLTFTLRTPPIILFEFIIQIIVGFNFYVQKKNLIRKQKSLFFIRYTTT